MICQRSSMAGQSLSYLFAALRNQTDNPKFTTPDKNIVTKTNHNHPATQCRMDTYFQGALCEIDDNTQVDQRDYKVGTCTRSDNHERGIRPLCWFKP